MHLESEKKRHMASQQPNTKDQILSKIKDCQNKMRDGVYTKAVPQVSTLSSFQNWGMHMLFGTA